MIYRIAVVIIILFLLSYFNIFRIEEYINSGQIRGLFQSFIIWFKGLTA